MRAFDYIRSGSIDETCSVLAEYGPDARILAGGTDVLLELRRPDGKPPKAVIDISFLDEFGTINLENGSVRIKPLATHTQLLQSSILHQYAPLLAAAASLIGSPQIRNRGTIGGNIMNAAVCADTVPPLIALGARVTLKSKRGSRQMGIDELIVRPYVTNARPDELLTEIRFQKLSEKARSAFIKLGRRNALSIARLSVAAVIEQNEQGKIVDARIAPGAAFSKWRRADEAEKMLIGEKPSEKLFAAAGQKVSELMISETGRRWSTEYKEPVIGVLVRRALEGCRL
jgi:carbon-monoxide dehydrogenase medium subunit/xanthine dehydrogenase FAD-binding subunit